MKLSFNVKSLGKKRPYIKDLLIDLHINNRTTLKDLLHMLVIHQVNLYNLRKQDKNLLTFFEEDQLNDLAQTGNVKFNENYSTKQAEPAKAVDSVLQAFKDGLIALFVDGVQIEDVNQMVHLDESSSITIIKLTFLTGTFW